MLLAAAKIEVDEDGIELEAPLPERGKELETVVLAVPKFELLLEN